jgi:hypothetical protein
MLASTAISKVRDCVREVIAYCKKRQDKKVIQAISVVPKSLKENLGLIFSRVCLR